MSVAFSSIRRQDLTVYVVSSLTERSTLSKNWSLWPWYHLQWLLWSGLLGVDLFPLPTSRYDMRMEMSSLPLNVQLMKPQCHLVVLQWSMSTSSIFFCSLFLFKCFIALRNAAIFSTFWLISTRAQLTGLAFPKHCESTPLLYHQFILWVFTLFNVNLGNHCFKYKVGSKSFASRQLPLVITTQNLACVFQDQDYKY